MAQYLRWSSSLADGIRQPRPGGWGAPLAPLQPSLHRGRPRGLQAGCVRQRRHRNGVPESEAGGTGLEGRGWVLAVIPTEHGSTLAASFGASLGRCCVSAGEELWAPQQMRLGFARASLSGKIARSSLESRIHCHGASKSAAEEGGTCWRTGGPWHDLGFTSSWI